MLSGGGPVREYVSRVHSPRCLVIDPSDGPGQLGEWLTGAGLVLDVRPAGPDLPADLAGYSALVVLGGHQPAGPGPDGPPAGRPRVESLLRQAVRDRVPTLGICRGAHLLALAHGGTVGPAAGGLAVGPRLVAKRDAARLDPLFGPLPMLPDVVVWHDEEITELPPGAVLLATDPRHAVQAFRLGSGAWGVQFHVECDTAMLARWAAGNAAALAALGLDADEVVGAVDVVMDDLFEVWHPFAARFAGLAKGELELPRGDPAGR